MFLGLSGLVDQTTRVASDFLRACATGCSAFPGLQEVAVPAACPGPCSLQWIVASTGKDGTLLKYALSTCHAKGLNFVGRRLKV